MLKCKLNAVAYYFTIGSMGFNPYLLLQGKVINQRIRKLRRSKNSFEVQ